MQSPMVLLLELLLGPPTESFSFVPACNEIHANLDIDSWSVEERFAGN